MELQNECDDQLVEYLIEEFESKSQTIEDVGEIGLTSGKETYVSGSDEKVIDAIIDGLLFVDGELLTDDPQLAAKLVADVIVDARGSSWKIKSLRNIGIDLKELGLAKTRYRKVRPHLGIECDNLIESDFLDER